MIGRPALSMVSGHILGVVSSGVYPMSIVKSSLDVRGRVHRVDHGRGRQ